jgi:hypothetical protein
MGKKTKSKKRERAVGGRIGSFCPKKLTSELRRSSCIDKIVLKVPGIAPIEKIMEMEGMLWKPIGRIRRFPSSWRFLTPDGVNVTVHIRTYDVAESRIELNPNQLRSWSELVSLVEIFAGCDAENIGIHEIHYNVDLKIKMEVIRGRINPRYLKKIAYYKVMETWMSGHCRELKTWSGYHTTYFGSEDSKQVVVYDRQRQKNYRSPQTRVEIRLTGKKKLGFLNLQILREYLAGDMDPFHGVQFYKIGNPKFTEGQHFLKYDHMIRLIEQYGIKWTRAYVTAHCQKPRRPSAYGFLWKSRSKVTYPLYSKWRKNMDGYLLRKPRKEFLKIWGIK